VRCYAQDHSDPLVDKFELLQAAVQRANNKCGVRLIIVQHAYLAAGGWMLPPVGAIDNSAASMIVLKGPLGIWEEKNCMGVQGNLADAELD
jgi:hypothetical protein